MTNEIKIGQINFSVFEVIKFISIVSGIVIGYMQLVSRLDVITIRLESMEKQIALYQNEVKRIDDHETRITVLEKEAAQ
jgi:hypothetical protein